MSANWVKLALESALLTVDNGELVRSAGEHVLVEGEWAEGKIRPSLLGGECDLQTAKKLLGHGPQPGSHWMAARGGRPNANSNVVFARGFLGEGLLVAALKRYAELSGSYEVLGCAPSLLFSADPDYEAHPDMLVLRKGVIETIQIKTPSVWLFERMSKQDPSEVLKKYATQIVTEMFVGRRQGIEIERGNLLVFTWEGYRPGTPEGDKVRIMTDSIDWEPEMENFVEEMASSARKLRNAAKLGQWPTPANREDEYAKWPCSYCQYARTKTYEGQITCTEVEEWERPESTQERLSKLTETATASPLEP